MKAKRLSRVDLRAAVVARCESVLRQIVVKAGSAVNPNAFADGFHRIREHWLRAATERAVDRKAARAVYDIKMSLKAAPVIFDEARRISLGETGYIGELRRLLEHFETLEFPGAIPLPWEIEDGDSWTHHRAVLHEFDSKNFLGIRGRRATTPELAVISLILDSETGVTLEEIATTWTPCLP